MDKTAFHVLAALAALPLAGCFTLTETPAPKIEIAQAAESAPAVNIGGYAVEVVNYIPVYGWETRYDSGWGYGGRRGRYRHPHWQTVATETYIPQAGVTDFYLRRAAHLLEDSGLIVATTNAQYEISGEFTGPFTPEGTRWRMAAIDIGSLFFALYDASEWQLEVRIRDTSTGRVVFSRSLRQEYECCAFSPFWLFGLAMHDGINGDWQKSWCLQVLTDRSVAEISKFLQSAQKGGTKGTARGAKAE